MGRSQSFERRHCSGQTTPVALWLEVPPPWPDGPLRRAWRPPRTLRSVYTVGCSAPHDTLWRWGGPILCQKIEPMWSCLCRLSFQEPHDWTECVQTPGHIYSFWFFFDESDFSPWKSNTASLFNMVVTSNPFGREVIGLKNGWKNCAPKTLKISECISFSAHLFSFFFFL